MTRSAFPHCQSHGWGFAGLHELWGGGGQKKTQELFSELQTRNKNQSGRAGRDPAKQNNKKLVLASRGASLGDTWPMCCAWPTARRRSPVTPAACAREMKALGFLRGTPQPPRTFKHRPSRIESRPQIDELGETDLGEEKHQSSRIKAFAMRARMCIPGAVM